MLLVVLRLPAGRRSTIARDDLARTRGDALASFVYLTNWHLIIASHSYFNAVRPSLAAPAPVVAGGRGAVLPVLAARADAAALKLLAPALHGRAHGPARARLDRPDVGPLRPGPRPLARLLRHRHARRARCSSARCSRSPGRSAASATRSSARARRAGSTRSAASRLLAVLALFVRVQDYDPWLYRGGFLLVALCSRRADRGRRASRRAFSGARWDAARCAGSAIRSYGIYLWHWPVMMLSRPGIDVPWRGDLRDPRADRRHRRARRALLPLCRDAGSRRQRAAAPARLARRGTRRGSGCAGRRALWPGSCWCSG